MTKTLRKKRPEMTDYRTEMSGRIISLDLVVTPPYMLELTEPREKMIMTFLNEGSFRCTNIYFHVGVLTTFCFILS